jgi:imidazole glycerol-phosphate synthase subunit HisH
VTPTIAIVDYGMGNRRSVEKAIERVGGRAAVTRDHEAIAAADGAIVPGVGAFAAAMASLHGLGLDEVLRDRAAAGGPILGICLGMQVLFGRSSEFGETEGLGLLGGEVAPLEAGELRLPHIGWSLVSWERDSPLNAGVPRECAFYHVHSYAARPSEPGDVLATAEYGGRFVTAVRRGALSGVQFHAEKSSTHGLALLEGFVREAALAAA